VSQFVKSSVYVTHALLSHPNRFRVL